MFSHSDYKVSFKLQADIQKAVEAKDMQLLKTLLQHESLDFGVVDDASANMFMTAFIKMRTNNPGATFNLSEMVTSFKSKTL